MKHDNKILMIVDDDPDDRFFFREAIKEIDSTYQYTEARDGVEALTQLRVTECLPDYIFMDINMPRMGGPECLTVLKNDEKLRNIPVVMYSTSNYKKDIELAFQLGAIDYLVKPTDPMAIKIKIVTAIGKAERDHCSQNRNLTSKERM